MLNSLLTTTLISHLLRARILATVGHPEPAGMVRQGGFCGKIVHISFAEPSCLRVADIAGSRPAETIPNSSGFGPHLSFPNTSGTGRRDRLRQERPVCSGPQGRRLHGGGRPQA